MAWRTTVDTAQSTGWRAVWEARHAAVARASDRSTLADAGHEVARASWLSVLEQRAHLIKNMDQHLETIPMTDPNKVPWKDLLEDLRAVMRTPRFQQAFPEVQALFHQTVDMIATLTSKTPHQTRPGSDDGAPSFEDLLNHMEQSLRRSDRAAKERITWRARECTNEAQEAVSSGPTPTQRACVIL